MEFELRPWILNDVDSLVKHGNNANVARFMADRFPHPYTREKGIAFIEFANSELPVHFFAIIVNGEAAGGIGIHPQSDIMRRNAELGYWLSEMYWGNGIVTRAIRQMVTFGFATYDIDRIFARAFGNNPASQRVLEKSGFEFETRFHETILKNGEKIDELFYAVRRDRVNPAHVASALSSSADSSL
jgi:[ribosomal protein S5]-alanine N-acetyltransferase